MLLCQVVICPSCNAKCQEQSKESYSSLLPKQHERRLYRLVSLVTKQHKNSNQCPHQHFMQSAERGPAARRLVQIRQSSQCGEYSSNSCNPRKFVRNATLNGVHPQKIPLGHNVRWSRIGVCWNIVVRVPQKLGIKSHEICCLNTLPQSSSLVFSIVVGVEMNQIGLRRNTQGVCRPVLVQSSKVHQTQSSQKKGKEVVQTKKAIQCRVINTEATPQPANNCGTNDWQSTSLAGNDCSSP